MQRGEVWEVELPEGIGREQHGIRPAIVLSNPISNMVIIAPLTSQLKALAISNTILIESDSRNGLKSPSVVLVFQLSSKDKKRFKRKLGKISKQILKEIKEEIKLLIEI